MNEPKLEEIIEARDECARLIALYGDQILPIFERLESEIAIREKRQELLNRALEIAQKNTTQNATQSATQFRSS